MLEIVNSTKKKETIFFSNRNINGFMRVSLISIYPKCNSIFLIQFCFGLARYVTDIRSNTDNKSAATTAMNFAEGRTTIEVFEA